MILDDLRNADFSDIGSSPVSVRGTLLALAVILILVAGYFLFIKDKRINLEQVRQQELALMADF